MATKPTKFPEWAKLNPTDPVSGQPAIIEPSTSKKNSGFLREEEPPRQDINWLHNLTNQWLEWLSQEVTLARFAPPGFVNGFKLLSNDEANLNIYKGVCRLGIHDVSSPWTKNVISSNAWVDWSEGDLGGLIPNDHASISMTWMHIFAISNDEFTQLDFAADSNLDASTILANSVISASGYTKAKRIGSIAVRDDSMSGNYKIARFESFNNDFVWVDPYIGWGTPFVYDEDITTTPTYYTMKLGNVPSGTEKANMNVVPRDNCIAKFQTVDTITQDFVLYSKTINNYGRNMQYHDAGNKTVYEIPIVESKIGLFALTTPTTVRVNNLSYKDLRNDFEL